MRFLRYIPRFIFHVSEFEKQIRRRSHTNTLGKKADWIWTVSESYFYGYNQGLVAGKSFDTLKQRLDNIDPELRGFAYEGAGTALALLEVISPFHKKDLKIFLNKYAKNHYKTTSAGIGIAYARIGASLKKKLLNFDTETAEFIIDGYAFYYGCLKNIDFMNITPPYWMTENQQQVFIRGFGRSLWFRVNGNIGDAAKIIKKCNEADQEILWKGLAIGCAYAGKLLANELSLFQHYANKHLTSIVEGFYIAYEARQRAQNQIIYTAEVYYDGLRMLNNIADSSMIFNASSNSRRPIKYDSTLREGREYDSR